jgi:hypothetical protein
MRNATVKCPQISGKNFTVKGNIWSEKNEDKNQNTGHPSLTYMAFPIQALHPERN